jgi:hypothetical protein
MSTLKNKSLWGRKWTNYIFKFRYSATLSLNFVCELICQHWVLPRQVAPSSKMHPHHQSYPQQAWNQWTAAHLHHLSQTPAQSANMNNMQQLHPNMPMWGSVAQPAHTWSIHNGQQLQQHQQHVLPATCSDPMIRYKYTSTSSAPKPAVLLGNPSESDHDHERKVISDRKDDIHQAASTCSIIEEIGHATSCSAKDLEPLIESNISTSSSHKPIAKRTISAVSIKTAALKTDIISDLPVSATVVEQQNLKTITSPDSRKSVGRKASDATKHVTTKGEACALIALSSIFPGKTFIKIRPHWLRNDRTGRLLEIDLYCHELRVGVEHNGPSHYVYPNSLHKTRDEFDAQVYRDELKKKLCAEAGRGVLLIHIPFTVPHKSMESFIRSEIERLTEADEQLHMPAQ